MTGNQHHEIKDRHPNYTATRFKANHNWCYRGDNTKYKEKK